MQGNGPGSSFPVAAPAPRATTIGYEQSPLFPGSNAPVGCDSAPVAPQLSPLETGATIVAPATSAESAATVLAPRALTSGAAVSLSSPSVSGRVAIDGRSTVLPRFSVVGDQPQLVVESRERYQETKILGAGGVGEVVAARDQDIERDVAIKRLLPEMQGPAAVSRFVDEIRTVGQLEHPNIVPIHDVGIDDKGRYFFVMKHVHGENLEDIITKLAAGDPAYHQRYGFERRAQIFQGILEAVHYAHEKGIIHRDIKPANVMVGNYGEVVVMDWGIAKHLGTAATVSAVSGDDAVPAPAPSAMGTVVGSLLGTPAYMSPEQARGENDKLDVRSDIYSLCVLFWEFLALKHYLDGKNSLQDILAGVVMTPASHPTRFSHPVQGSVPADLGWFALGGLHKSPELRFQSVAEMIVRLQLRNEGVIPVQCHLTFAKRLTSIWSRFVDRHPMVMTAALALTALWVVGSIAWGAFYLVRSALAG